MRDLNKVTLMGTLATEPFVKELAGGNAFVRFTVVTGNASPAQKAGKPERSLDSHSVVAFGKLAEIIGKYLKRGDRVYLDGRMKSSPRHQSEVLADNLIMLGTSGNRRAWGTKPSAVQAGKLAPAS